MLNITIDDSEVRSALTKLSSKVDNMQPALNEIGHHIESKVVFNFDDETDPYGKPWKSLSKVTQARRREGKGSLGNKILQDSGVLKGSITNNASNFAVEIGTNVEYAPTHQKGSKSRNIPARPFLPTERGLPGGLKEDVLKIVSRHLELALV